MTIVYFWHPFKVLAKTLGGEKSHAEPPVITLLIRDKWKSYNSHYITPELQIPNPGPYPGFRNWASKIDNFKMFGLIGHPIFQWKKQYTSGN